MIIGVSLNEVIRDFRGQFEKMYNKYHPQDEETEPKEIDKTKFNLLDNFYFSGGTEELNKFLYFDSSLEIFGHANELHTNIITHLNQFHNDMEDEGHTIMIISKELANSKPSTLFFLSKTTCKVNTIKFVRKSEDKWNHVDIMITADPDVLNLKQYLEFGGKEFYIDFDKLRELVVLEETTKNNNDDDLNGNIHIDVTKYETIREMLGVIMDNNTEVDDKMGVIGLNSLPISFKIAYNTLIHYDILNEVE